MAQSQQELLSEIAKKLRILECICKNTASSGGAIVKDYQPLDCNGDPVGTPLDVMATISVAIQDVSVCNYQQLADAINLGQTNPYNVPFMTIVGESSEFNLIVDGGLDVTKLHSVSFSVLGTTGTVDISGDLGAGNQNGTLIPVGASSGWTATTTFGSGTLNFTTTANARVLITATLSA